MLSLIFFGLANAGTVNNPSVYEGDNAVITYELGYAAPFDGVEVRVKLQMVRQLEMLIFLLPEVNWDTGQLRPVIHQFLSQRRL